MHLKSVRITNFKSIKEDEINLENFTFLVGKNNYGKSNYLKAIDYLLSFSLTYSNIEALQNNKNEPVTIEGCFFGVDEFTPYLKESKHKEAVEKLMNVDGSVVLRLTINPQGEADTSLIDPSTGKPTNPTGFKTSLRKIFPEPIFVPATADTAAELQEKSTSALSKIKKEILHQFFSDLSTKIDEVFQPIDQFLHGQERAPQLSELENDLAAEMMGEFSNVKPSLKFELPTSSFIGRGMKITLHDGFHDCEIEDKGNGLQRTSLFALMRLLCKHQSKNQTKPKPIFLIEELEAFLHPSAQQELANSIEAMSKSYQTITTTHSPFVLSPNLLGGYRRITRDDKEGSKCITSDTTIKQKDNHIELSLSHTKNLISLFSDKVIIIEGKHDTGVFPALINTFDLKTNHLVSFIEAGGCAALHIPFNFFQSMGFQNIPVIADLDCLFNTTFEQLLKLKGIDGSFIQLFRNSIQWTETKQPSLEYVLQNIDSVKIEVTDKITELAREEIYILSKGAPEFYYSKEFKDKFGEADVNLKSIGKYITSLEDLNETEELISILAKATNLP